MENNFQYPFYVKSLRPTNTLFVCEFQLNESTVERAQTEWQGWAEYLCKFYQSYKWLYGIAVILLVLLWKLHGIVGI